MRRKVINLQKVIKYMNKGWPMKIKCISILFYFQSKADLQYETQLPAKRQSLRGGKLAKLPKLHLGIVKMKFNVCSGQASAATSSDTLAPACGLYDYSVKGIFIDC